MLADFYHRAGTSVQAKHDPKRIGKIMRVYPFHDRANLLVKWRDGGLKSYRKSDLVLYKSG